MLMHRYADKWKMAGGRASPYNLGSKSKSDSSTSTTTHTSNQLTSWDTRSVAQDSAISLGGNGNWVDRSTSSLTQFSDASTTTSLTQFTDNSDRSVTNVTTDHGAISGALAAMGTMTTQAFGVADNAIGGGIDVLKMQVGASSKAIERSFDLMAATAANSASNSAKTLGFASDALEKTQQAFQDAKDGAQSKMVMAAIVAAAIVAVAFAVKRS